MDENELLERTLTILEHTNKQVGECLRMMAEKDAEIAELEKHIKILEASGWPDTKEGDSGEDEWAGSVFKKEDGNHD